MWLFTKHGFFSVTQADRADRIQIRARTDRHLKNLQEALPELQRSPIIETRDADYRWRMVVARYRWELVARHLTDEIDYRNFKSKVGSHGTAVDMISELHDIWATMHSFQNRKHRPDPLAGHPTLFKEREALFDDLLPDDDASAGWASYAGRSSREEPPDEPEEEEPTACDFCGTTSGDVGTVTLGNERFNCCPHCWDGDPQNPPAHPRAQAAAVAAMAAPADAFVEQDRLAAENTLRRDAERRAARQADMPDAPAPAPESMVQAQRRRASRQTPNPWKIETWNLTQQCKILKADRQQAMRLAGEAGVTFPEAPSDDELRRNQRNKARRDRRAAAAEAKEAEATKERITAKLAKQNRRAAKAAKGGKLSTSDTDATFSVDNPA